MPGRSHYNVLGVSPGADPEAIRRAYLRQARRWHPDRPTGDSEKMREVNEAWQVLGDIRSRAAYDRSLARSAPRAPAGSRPNAGRAAAGPRQSPGPPNAQAPPRSRAANHQQQTPTAPLEVVSIRWRWVGLAVAALVALAVVLIFVASSATDDSDPNSPEVASAPVFESRPQPGDCFLIGTTTLITVGCDHPHDGKLVAWVPLGAPCDPDTELHYVRAAQRAVCYHPPSG